MRGLLIIAASIVTSTTLGVSARHGAAAQAARSIPGVQRAEGRQAALRAYSDRGGELIPALIRVAEAQGRTVKNINLATPSLETLFISLTGRKLD